jgi:hypothetical protein
VEPIEDTDKQTCEHCGYAGLVRNFRRPGKFGPNFVCPNCFFSSETFFLYLEDKHSESQNMQGEFKGFISRKKLSPELYLEYSRIESRIQARKAKASQGGSSGCVLVLIGIPSALLILLSIA